MRSIPRSSEPVLLVSPDLRPSVLGVAHALQGRGQLRGLVTGIALPRVLADGLARVGARGMTAAFRSRIVPPWLTAPVESIWRFEALNLLARRAGVPQHITHELWRRAEPAFDRHVGASWAGRVRCVYGVENASVETFEAQRRAGGLNMLWQVIAHPQTLARVQAETGVASSDDTYARVSARDQDWVNERKRRQYAAADRIVCNSDFVRDSFVQAGIEPSRLVCVPTACPPAVVAPPTPQRDPRVVLFAGQLARRKGVLELVQAFSMLRPKGVELWLAGQAMLPRAALGRLPDSVRLLGALPRDRLAALLPRASLFVLPTHAEGRSYAVLEAVSAGVPCLTTPASGCTDVVVDGESGRIVPAGDPVALAAAMDACLAQPARMHEFACAALERARRWNAAAFTEAHGQVVQQLLQGEG